MTHPTQDRFKFTILLLRAGASYGAGREAAPTHTGEGALPVPTVNRKGPTITLEGSVILGSC